MYAHQSKEHQAVKNVKGHLSITKPSNHEGSTICIKLQDQSSRVTIAEAEISLEGFADAVTGLAMVECNIKTPTSDVHQNVGKQVITQSVPLPVPEVSKYHYPLVFKSHLKTSFAERHPKLVEEGWTIWDYGMTRRQESTYKHFVILRKYVEADQS